MSALRAGWAWKWYQTNPSRSVCDACVYMRVREGRVVSNARYDYYYGFYYNYAGRIHVDIQNDVRLGVCE